MLNGVTDNVSLYSRIVPGTSVPRSLALLTSIAGMLCIADMLPPPLLDRTLIAMHVRLKEPQRPTAPPDLENGVQEECGRD